MRKRNLTTIDCSSCDTQTEEFAEETQAKANKQCSKSVAVPIHQHQKHQKIENNYSGWRVPAVGEVEIDRINFRGNFTSLSFFNKYVRTRRPVVIVDAEGPDDRWQGGKKWTFEYLQTIAGTSKVRIEYREDDNHCFGRGKHSYVDFAAFLDILKGRQKSNEVDQFASRVYLTTQDLGQDSEGRPNLHSPPCTQLFRAGDFPLRPMVLDTLIPMNYNLWMGSTRITSGTDENKAQSTTPSSSGLHHDFHDNLYVLLQGRKKFRIFSPEDASRMYTVGKIELVHANGRICYSDPKNSNNKVCIEADGSDAQVGAFTSALCCCILSLIFFFFFVVSIQTYLIS